MYKPGVHGVPVRRSFSASVSIGLGGSNIATRFASTAGKTIPLRFHNTTTRIDPS